MLCSSCWYIIGPTFLFLSRGFPFVVAPAFSTPVTYSRIFHSYIFHPCCLLLIFHSYFFYSCIFSVPSVWHGSLTVNVRYERHSVLPMELSGLGGWTQQFMCTDAHFWVKLGFKLRPLGKISNISTSDPEHRWTAETALSLGVVGVRWCRKTEVDRALCRLHALNKLVGLPEPCASRLVQETCSTCVGQSGTSFFLVQISCTQLSTALFQHRNCVARDTNRATWLAGEFFWCKKLWWNASNF